MVEAPTVHEDAAARDTMLDTAKGIAVLGVVLIHAHAWLGAVGVHADALDFVTGRMTIPLPEFFFVSGAVVASSIVGPEASPATLRRRVASILWVYVLWQPVVFGYRVLGDTAVTRDTTDWPGEIARFLAFPVRPNGELWYLWALAVSLAVTYLTRRVPGPLVIAIATTLFVTVYPFGRSFIGPERWHQLGPGLQQVLPHAVFVVVGVRYGSVLIGLFARMRWWQAVIAVAVWQGYAAALATAPSGAREAGVVLQVVLGFIATFAVARSLTSVRSMRPLAALGRQSLPIYLLHTTVIVVLLAICVATDVVSVIRAATIPFAIALVALSVSTALGISVVVRRARAGWLFRAPPAVLGGSGDRP
jgi:uncharacterized membrane protein YcfT